MLQTSTQRLILFLSLFLFVLSNARIPSTFHLKVWTIRQAYLVFSETRLTLVQQW